MTDNDIIKANESNSVIQREKIKAIYPHIVVSGKKPYYNIHWYDVKQQKMICGFSSYKLNFVRKWLQEEFEIVDDDIENIINRLQAENERLKINLKAVLDEKADHTEAITEFAERLCEGRVSNDPVVIAAKCLLKEMVGEDK